MKFKSGPTLTTLCSVLFASILAFFAFLGAPTRHTEAASPSYVRIIHASPDIGTATVFVDGNVLLNNFQFGTVTPYGTIPAGPHNVQVGVIGTGPGAATITQTIQVQPGIAYTVAALGTASTGFSLQVFVDDNLVSSGAAKLRVYHLSPGMGTVNVVTNGSTVITGLSYKEASQYLSVPSGSYTFDINATQANTTLPVSDTLNTNTVTSIFAVGLPDGTPKIQFISQQVNGLPGVPGTGSDPNYHTPSSSVQPISSWIPDALLLLLLTGSIACYRVVRTRRAKA